MKKKIITLGVLSILLLSGFPAVTAIDYESKQVTPKVTNEDDAKDSSQSYPDLIPKIRYEVDNTSTGIHCYIQIINIGETDAFFPEGTVMAKDTYEFRFPIHTFSHLKFTASEDTIIEPKQTLERYAGTILFLRVLLFAKLTLLFARITLIVDPNNIVDEGPEGENNNIYLKPPLFRLH